MANMLKPPPRPSSSEQTPAGAADAPEKSGFGPGRLAKALFSKQVKFKRDEAGYKFVLESAARERQPDGRGTSSLAGQAAVKTVAHAKAHAKADEKAHEQAASTFKSTAPQTATAAGCLCELLDSAPGSRSAFRHLASIEHGLKTKDPEGLFLFDLSAKHLKQAQRQLDGLWMEPAPAKLAGLRSQITAALTAQERREKEAVVPQGSFAVLSSFLVDEKMQVSEGRASDFHELNQNWNALSLVPIKE